MFIAVHNKDSKTKINDFLSPTTSLDDVSYDSPYLPGYSVLLTFEVANYSANYRDAQLVKFAVLAIDWQDLENVIRQKLIDIADAYRANGCDCYAMLKYIEFIDTSVSCSPKLAAFISNACSQDDA